MAVVAGNVGSWKVSVRVEVGGNRTAQQADNTAALSVESAAALAPEWGRVEVRHGHGREDGGTLPLWSGRAF